MRRRLTRCGLLILLAAFSAVPAAAGTIVGSFYFERDIPCEGCDPFEKFTLDNSAEIAGPAFADLMFSAIIQINAIDHNFEDPSPIASGGFAQTNPLVPLAFTDASEVSLIFSIANAGLYPGTLSLSPFTFDTDDSSPLIFSAAVEYTENGSVPVAETPSWLVVAIALSALAVGRAFFV
jgi:hypothetical protein